MKAPRLCIEPDGTPHGSVLRCAGEIDLATVEEFRRALARSIWSGLSDVEVDLVQIVFLDSSAVEALLLAQRELANRQGRLRVIGGPRSARVFHVLGVDGLLQFTEVPPGGDTLLLDANPTSPLPSQELASIP